MKTLTVLEQINMLLKNCNRNGLTIKNFDVDHCCVFAYIDCANKDDILYKTVYSILPECEYKFKLIP